MKSLQNRFTSKHCGVVLACGIFMLNAYPSFAGTMSEQPNPNFTLLASQLSLEVPMQDNSTGSDTTPAAAPQSKPLQGGVHKVQRDADSETDLNALQGKTDDTKLQAGTSSDLFKLANEKLTHGIKLTADEYRNLGAGCAGFESDRTFFQNVAVVSVVYKDSPAYLAGIRKGDKLLAPDVAEDKKVEDPTIPRWSVSCGLAGSQVHVTVLRHNKPVELTLTRINIEDIEEPKYRHEWEQILAKLGNPTDGTFGGEGSYPLPRR